MRTLILTACVLAMPFLCRAQNHPQSLTPLVDIGAMLECSDHVGLRQYRSETVAYKGTSAFIFLETRRDSHGCHYSADLHVTRDGIRRKYSLPNAREQAFSIVDFSPEGSRLLLEGDLVLGTQNGEEFRDVEVTTASFSSGIAHWQNAWDIFGWRDCDATVEPQGFTSGGKLILSARPSVQDLHERRNCVAKRGLYEIGLISGSAKKMPDGLTIKQYGTLTEGPQHTCEADPDLVAKCFVVHGRLMFYNGGPSARIWKIGTHHLFGVTDEILPGQLGPR
ncbi:MAG: hypothetical protein ACRD37_07130, partial [Candidatus Acidiferrales bacterium]